MLENCRSLWSKVQNWKEEFAEQVVEAWGHHWEYYTQERAVLKGLPVAITTAAVAAYVFGCAPFLHGALFGAVNYLTLTSLSEIVRAHHEIKINKSHALMILGISGAISVVVVQTVCKTSVGYNTAYILAAAAFAGQLARQFLATEG